MVVVEVPCDLIVTHIPISKEELVRVSNEQDKTSLTDADISESSVLPERSNVNNAKGRTKSVRLDISFKSPSHTGLQTTELVYIKCFLILSLFLIVSSFRRISWFKVCYYVLLIMFIKYYPP